MIETNRFGGRRKSLKKAYLNLFTCINLAGPRKIVMHIHLKIVFLLQHESIKKRKTKELALSSLIWRRRRTIKALSVDNRIKLFIIKALSRETKLLLIASPFLPGNPYRYRTYCTL